MVFVRLSFLWEMCKIVLYKQVEMFENKVIFSFKRIPVGKENSLLSNEIMFHRLILSMFLAFVKLDLVFLSKFTVFLNSCNVFIINYVQGALPVPDLDFSVKILEYYVKRFNFYQDRSRGNSEGVELTKAPNIPKCNKLSSRILYCFQESL